MEATLEKKLAEQGLCYCNSMLQGNNWRDMSNLLRGRQRRKKLFGAMGIPCQLEFSFSSKEKISCLKDLLTSKIHDPEPYIYKPPKEMVS